jgi:AcrR family transcriptional regulator
LARRAAQIEVVDRVSRDRVRARHAKRSTTAERRGQIATVTRDLVARYGIHGASLARIAHGVGVTDAALYRHFGSKEDMLIAAYDTLADRVFAWIDSNADLPVVVRLREMGESHAELFSKDIMGFNGPMFQFNVWLPDDGVRAHVDKTHRAIMDALVDLVEQGKAEGTVSPDVDAELIVDEIYAWIWWEDLSYLRGLDPIGIEKGSAEMFSRILKDIVLL